MTYDLVIRNGSILDGTGEARYRADVGIANGKIIAIGRIREEGLDEVDATDCFVAPGFIDGHTHMDAQIFWDPLGSSSCFHGVTTVVMGNCGFTLAPCSEQNKDLVLRSLERAEDMSREAMLAGIKWSWDTFSEYLDTLDQLPKGINYSAYVGHSAIRSYVMGNRAFEEEASPADLEAMKSELADSLRAGAIGLSTTRSVSHMTADDRPVPSRLASWNELQDLVGVMSDLGAGLLELDNEKYEPGPARDEYLGRLGSLAIESGRPIFFMLVSPKNDPTFWKERLDLIDDVASKGGRIRAQVTTHEQMRILGFKTALPFDKLPMWSAFRSRSLTEQRDGLLNAETRKQLVDEAIHGNYLATIGSLGSGENVNLSPMAIGAAAAAQSRPPDYETIVILDSAIGPNRTVVEVSKELGVEPIELIIDLALASDFNQLFGQIQLNADLDTVLEILRHPRSVVGISDSGAHVSFLSDSSISTHLLAYWVREKGVFDWERGVQMLTSIPATAYGFADRGFVREGFAADLVVFDPTSVGPLLPTVEHDLPTGARRLKQTASGVMATIVNGEVILRENVPTGNLPGKLLRGPLYAVAAR